MRIIFIFYIFLSLCTPVNACELKTAKATLANYIWLTEDYPPYNYHNTSGKLVGIFPEILYLIYQELNIDLNSENIQVVPWARLYFSLEKESIYAGFSMTSTPMRALKFTLVPIPLSSKISILVLSQNKEKLQSIPKSELTIAVVREDIGMQLLKKLDFPAKQIETGSASNILKMLFYKRVDAIAYSENVAYFQYNKLGLSNDELVPLYTLDEDASTNYVFHKSTSACVINLFSESINRLHQQGKLEPIKNKHLKKRFH